MFGLRIDASSLLPKDDHANGFDNVASVLKVSPSFLDQYISAARAVTIRALGNPTARPVGLVYRASAADQSAYMEGQPLGTRGGMMVEHTFPVDGDYTIKLHEYPSLPIARTLGLEVHRRWRGDGVDVASLKPVTPFWANLQNWIFQVRRLE